MLVPSIFLVQINVSKFSGLVEDALVDRQFGSFLPFEWGQVICWFEYKPMLLS